jgi:PleD family two-component response regulator
LPPLRLPGGSDAIRCTCSFGIANCADGGLILEAMLIQADHALLVAKNRGRNRVEHAQPVLDVCH